MTEKGKWKRYGGDLNDRKSCWEEIAHLLHLCFTPYIHFALNGWP